MDNNDCEFTTTLAMEGQNNPWPFISTIPATFTSVVAPNVFSVASTLEIRLDTAWKPGEGYYIFHMESNDTWGSLQQ